MGRQPSSLTTLFGSIGRRAFIKQYWPQRPAWNHGRLSRLSSLHDLQTISDVLMLAARSRIEMKAVLPGRLHETNEIPIPSGPDSAISLYDAGATIVCNGVERWHAPLRNFTRALSIELGLPPNMGKCNLYMSPAGAGLPMHFDDHEVIVVQLGGSKKWRIAKNKTVTNPTSNSGPSLVAEVSRYASKRSVKRMPAGSTIHMSPGSALFLPRGYWHTTEAREPSISLTFGFRILCWGELVGTFLSRRLVQDPNWREPAWNAWKTNGAGVAAERRWRELCKRIMPMLESVTVSDLTTAYDSDELT